jgi:23S rRNA (uracil1939-C5)-methyltransferase
MVQIYKAPKTSNNRKKNSGSSRVLERLTAKITRMDHMGQGVVSDHSPIIFATGGLPGETCELDVVEQKPRYWKAKVNRVLSASASRIEPFCQHFDVCGGCQTQFIKPQVLIEQKQAAVTDLLLKFNVDSDDCWQSPLLGPTVDYRRKTRFSIDARNKNKIQIGFRQKDSKQIVSIASCEVLTKPLQALINPIQDCITKMHNPVVIGHITLLQGANVEQVCLRLMRQLDEYDLALWKLFAKSSQCQVVLERKDGSSELLAGHDASLFYYAQEDLKLEISANDFVQVNDEINQAMIKQAITWLDLHSTDTLLDLFCGVGNFSLPMALSCHHVIGVEGLANMVQKAKRNAQINSIDNCTFLCEDLSQMTQKLANSFHTCNKILLDPAREGARGILAQLSKNEPTHILYVSCNPATFARDAAEFCEMDYQIDKIALMDMFPNTAHTELMALFVRDN